MTSESDATGTPGAAAGRAVERVRLWCAAAACVLLAGAGLAMGWGMIGAPGGELFGHAWVQWWHGDALPGWPSGPEQWLVSGGPWPVIDPLPTAMAAALGRLVGLELAWNLGAMGAVALAFLGGALVARRVGGDPMVGGVALALAPSLQGALASGLTEDWAVGLAAVGLALVGHRDLRLAALGGVALGVLTWCGLVLAWAAGLAAVVLCVVAVARHRERWRGALLGGGLAALLAVPVALLQGDRLSGAGHRAGRFVEQAEPLWRLNPWRGADLASFLTPGRVDAGDALVRMHPGYLGLTLLALAVWGGRGRWWLVLVGAVALAPGARLAFAGQPLGLDNPAAWLAGWLPFGDLLNHHGRVLLLAAIALAALASRGAVRLPRSRRGWVAGVVALDLALLSPLGMPLPVTDVRPSALFSCAEEGCGYLANLSPGPLLVLPAGGPGVHFQRPLLDQRFHRRKLSLSPNRPGLSPAYGRTDSGRWLGGLAFPDAPPPPAVFTPPKGVAVLVVMAPHIDAVIAGIGPPDLRTVDAAAWDLVAR